MVLVEADADSPPQFGTLPDVQSPPWRTCDHLVLVQHQWMELLRKVILANNLSARADESSRPRFPDRSAAPLLETLEALEWYGQNGEDAEEALVA